jgi:hypothetical protein
MLALMLIFRLLSPVVTIFSLLPKGVFFTLLIVGLIGSVFYGKLFLAIGVVLLSILFKFQLAKHVFSRI